MQTFHRSYRSFLEFLQILVNIPSSLQGQQEVKAAVGMRAFTKWSHAFAGSLLPVCAERKKPSAVTDSWAPAHQGECRREPQAEATAAGPEHSTAARSHRQGGCTAPGEGSWAALKGSSHLEWETESV